MRRIRFAAALVALIGLSTSATAAPKACMTDAEVSGLVAYMAPAVLRSATTTCGPSLGANAFLPANGSMLAATYPVHADRSWPQAKSAMLKLMNEEQSAATKLLAGLSDKALRELIDAGFVQVVTKDIKVKDCPKIDRLTRSLGALPPEPVVQIVSGLMALTKDAPFPLCEAG